MTNSRLFLRHFKAGLSLAFIFCGLLAFGQYPAAPNKIALGRQTTGDGLVFRTSGKPAYTPTTAFNAWMAIDTTTGNLWTYRDNEWFLEVAGDLKLDYPLVINKSGVNIKRGQAVMVDTVQIVQGDQVRIRQALATVSNSQLIMGVATTDINNNATGYVTWFGYVREVDAANITQSGDTLDVGDILYLSATDAGKYSDTPPTQPNVNSTIALVIRKPSANNMTLLVRPWLNEKLGDLRDVDLAGLQTGDGIKWNGTKWVAGQFAGTDSTVVSAGYGIDVSEVANNFTVSADTSELATPYDVSLKQDKLNGTGLVKSTSGTISYITDNSTNWDAAYNDRITSAAFSGSGTKTLTLTQQDAGTVTASFADLQGVTSVATGVGLSGGTITTTGTISADTSVLSTKWYAADTASGVRDWVVAQGYTSNTGTVTSIATNNGITGGTITTSGTIGLTGQALALHNVGGTGFFTRGAGGSIALRSIDAGTGISISDGSGLSGNPTITNSAPDQTVVLTAGTGISTSGTYPNFTITNNAPEATSARNINATGEGVYRAEVGNELQFKKLVAGSNVTLTSADSTITIASTAAGTGTVTSIATGYGLDGGTITTSGTLSVDTSEIATPYYVTSQGYLTTEVDGSVSNEGTLGVGAGSGTTAVVTSNTSGANGVTIAAGSNIAITESTSSNGGTVTIAATGIPTKLPIQFRGASNSQSGNTPINYSYDLTDTLNFGYLPGSGLFLDNDSSANKINVIYEIDHSVISTVSRLADSTSTLRAAFPTTIYSGNGTLTTARTISTNGNKLTISGSNTAQVLEINNTNTGTTTNALTLQSFGPPLQATRLTSSTGSILPVSDYFVNTSSTAAAGLGGFQRFYIEDAGGLNKEAGRIGFRTSDATGSSYDSEAFISVRKDSSELKEGLTLLSTGQLHLKEYGDTTFTGTAVKYLAVDNDGKVIEVDGAAGTVKGTGAANKVAIWASADSLYQNTNFHWDNTNGRLGIGTSAPTASIHIKATTSSDGIIAFADTGFVGSLDILKGTLNTEQFGLLGGNFDVYSNNSGNRSNFSFRRARGTIYSISPVQANDWLGSFFFHGSNASNAMNSGSAGFAAFVDGTVGALTVPTRFSFITGESSSNRAERLTIKASGNIGIATTVPSSILSIGGNSARTIGTERHTTANTAGNSLTLKVGGATSGATDKAGGDLILESGVSTGNASSNIIFETAAAGAAGTTDRTPVEVARINGAGKLGLGTTSPNGRLEIVEINPLTTTQLEVLTITSNTSTTPSSGLGSKIIFRGETTTTESSPQSEIVSLWQTATHASRRSRIAFRTIENGGEMSNRVVINGDKVGVGLNHNSPTNTLDVQGSFGRGAPVTVTDSLYGVPLTTNWIIANRSGQIQLVLPTASDFTGRELMVKTITANTVISANSNVVPLIGGTAGTAILPATDGAWATLVSDGTNWIIMQSGQ